MDHKIHTNSSPKGMYERGKSTHGKMFNIISHCCCLVTQLCLTLCSPMDCSPLGSSVYGIFQARILEWVAVPSSRGSSQPSDRTLVSYISCIDRWVLYL